MGLSLRPTDGKFFDLFSEAGRNTLRAARMLDQMMGEWPDDTGLGREILLSEQEGDRITHNIIRRLNTTSRSPMDRDETYALATKLDDVVDYIEEAADFLGLYSIEAPMTQANELTSILVACCTELAEALDKLSGFQGVDPHLIEIHRLENDGDRVSRDAVAALFSNGIDPMVVIRWKDIFAVLEKAIDATESTAHIIEGILIRKS
jgi:predicted phosphate transport protein (TIGR00153 family)